MRTGPFLATVLAVGLSAVGTAHADGFSFSVGKGLAAVDLGQGGVDAGGLADLSTRIGYRAGNTVPFALLDYTRVGVTETLYGYSCDEFDCEDHAEAVEARASLLTLGGGMKHLFNPRAGAACPYLVGALYAGIPSTESDGRSSDEIDDPWAIGALAGFGGEYAFADSFALGGEMGLNVFYASLDDDPTVSFTQVYSAITLNFYL